MVDLTLTISIGTIVGAAVSVYFSRKLWFEANRPLVTVAICTHKSGERGTALYIMVTNSGNRPAGNVQLTIESATLDQHLAPGARDGVVLGIKRGFTEDGMIPVLRNGESVRNSFGFLAGGQETSTWRREALLPITITYVDIATNRQFKNSMLVRVANNDAFARSDWEMSRR